MQWGGSNPKYALGDSVDILYNPRNPSRAIINSWMPYVVLTIFTLFFAVVILHSAR